MNDKKFYAMAKAVAQHAVDLSEDADRWGMPRNPIWRDIYDVASALMTKIEQAEVASEQVKLELMRQSQSANQDK